jgi:succinyl-diaminopimelate desuccinylase
LTSLEYEIDLLAKMVEINTNSISKEGYTACASVIVNEAEQNSLDVEIVDGEKGARDGLSRPNVIVSLNAGSDVTLLLEAHFDIVPSGPGWSYSPFKLTIEDGKAYGRGTADNKSGIVAAIGALRQLNKKKLDMNIKLIATVDEEVGGRYGADFVLNDYGLKGDAALILDAGPERLYLGASGFIWGKIVVEGTQGHAGYPFKAKNAIEETLKLLKTFESYREAVEKKESSLRAPPTSPRKFVWGRYSVTMIKAGEKENIIPNLCEVRFDRRLLPEESAEQAEKELRVFFQKAVKTTGCKASLDIVNRLPGYYTSSDRVFVKTVSENIEKSLGRRILFAGELGGNDGSFFAKNGIPTIGHGTLRSDTGYHGVNEFVYLNDLKNIRDLIVNIGQVERGRIVSLLQKSS